MGRFNFLCVDESKNTVRAWEWYLENYHRPDDTIGLIHIIHIPNLSTMGVLVGGSITVENKAKESINKTKENAEKIVNGFVKICEQAGHQYKVLLVEDHRTPGEVICELVKKNKADSIILAQRGLSEFSRTLLGSTSDHVLHHSDIPVLIVPPVRD